MHRGIDVPDRRRALDDWTGGGGRFAAVFPIHYPRELLRAHGLLPVEVWGPPGFDESPAAAHLQTYTCAIVRRGLAFATSGALEGAAALLVPHACDSLQGLGSILLDFLGGRTPPVLPFYLPRGNRTGDLDFLAAELRALSRRLGELTGLDPSPDELGGHAAREVEADRLLAELHRLRTELPLDDPTFYRVARSREYLPAERFVELARRALELERSGPRAGVPVVLSGIVPEPMAGLFGALSEAGARVAADDLACCGRRLYPEGRSSEPYRRMAERILGAPPDPTRGSSIAARIDHLSTLVSGTGAKGVVFYDVKFCEPELFDLPELRAALQARGIPSLALEVDLASELPHQAVTRLEAFVEMLT